MSIIPFLITIAVALFFVGFIVWLIDKAPLSQPYKEIIKGLIVFVVILYLLVMLLEMLGYNTGIQLRLR